MAVMVHVELTREADGNGAPWWRARMTRTAESVDRLCPTSPLGSAGVLVDDHLAAEVSAPYGARLQRCADVLYERGQYRRGEAEVCAAETLRRFPGCAVVAVGGDGALVAVCTRTGHSGWIRCDAPPDRRPSTVASLVHSWLAVGPRLADFLAMPPILEDHPTDSSWIRPASRSVSRAPSDR